MPLTEGQLRSKRDEFWDTAPAFDGRKEIWDALRAATVAAEALDFQLSQAILDGANISVPNGYEQNNLYFSFIYFIWSVVILTQLSKSFSIVFFFSLFRLQLLNGVLR